MPRHTKLVSSLFLLAGGIATMPALEIGAPGSGLQIGGWGEAFARGEHHDAGNPNNSNAGTINAEDKNDIDFSADALLKAAYTVDQFSLRLDVFITNKPQYTDDQNDGNNVILEQAYIDWKFSERATLRAGRFRDSWIGWEGYHTPELFRVNQSAVWSWNVRDHGQLKNRPFVADGVGLTLTAPEDPLSLSFYVVDDVLGDAPDAKGTDVAYGANITWAPTWLGQVELGAVFDPNSMTESGVGASNGAALDFNVDVTTWRDQGWFFAGEVQYHFHGDLNVNNGPDFGDALMWLVMANYAVTDSISLTAMVDHVDRGLDLPDNEILEVAFAVLTKPHKQVRLNFEIFHWDESAPDADSYGAAAVILLELP
jgi:hypothetical protein